MSRPSRPELFVDRLPSPIGAMLVVHDAEGRLRALEFADCELRMRQLLRLYCGTCTLHEGPASATTRDALAAYFAGDLAALDSIDVETGGTVFQRDVWTALRTIRAGTMMSYGGLARRIGRPRAVRAVGSANGANPVSIVVPCHRVIGADASLTGYGGGLKRKRWLLIHEGAALS